MLTAFPRVSAFLCALSILTSMGACGGEESHEAPEEVEAETTETATESAEAAPETEAAETDPAELEEGEAEPNGAALAGASEESLEAEVEAAEETVRAAVEEASAAEVGSTYCESAYEGLTAMIRRVAAQFPDNTRTMPDRDRFMSVCDELPEGVQQCLLPSYATAHQSECAEQSASLSAEDQERLTHMLAGE